MEEISKNNETTQLDIGGALCSAWFLTPQLRWKQKEVDMADGTAVNTGELQQMWQSSNGEEKWEAVPFYK